MSDIARWLPALRAGALGVAALIAVPLAAHDPGLSGLQVRLTPDAIAVEMTLAAADFAAGPAKLGELASVGRGFVRVAGAAPLTWDHFVADNDEDGGVVLRYQAARHADAEFALDVPLLAAMPFGHRQFVVVTEGTRQVAQALLGRDARSMRWSLGPAETRTQAPLAVATGFVATGVEHVVTGYDHLLFLLGLLLTVASWRQALGVVTTFTVAHSLTLAAATFQVVSLPGTLVECAIAASVAFVGAENLLRDVRRPRIALTFLFGLVHGLGFAGCLADLGTASGMAMALPLLTFNLGVEVGQLALVACGLPVLLWLRRRPRLRDPACTGLSLVVLVAGALWLLERLP